MSEIIRVGKYTGKVYKKDYDFSKCPECVVNISEEQYNDSAFMINLQIKKRLDCDNCQGCPAYIRSNP